MYAPDNDDVRIITRHQIMAALLIVLLVIALFIGVWVTPWVGGQPLLLTRENLAVKAYLDAYGQRLAAMEKEHAELTSLVTTNRSASVFSLSQRGRAVLANLEALAREVERTRVPAGLSAPDLALREALAAELFFTDQTLTYAGKADDSSRSDALAAGEDAKSKLGLARQQQNAMH